MTAPQEDDLPLEVVPRGPHSTLRSNRWFQFRKRYLLILLIPLFLFSGAVIGMYFQPPALQKFYALTGLQPGGGATTPIALPPDIELPPEMVETMQVTDVVGLARLMPLGDVSIVAPPYGAGDARIAEILVAIGDRVEKGSVVARLDNEGQLESAVQMAKANVAVRQAALIQTRAAVHNSRDEAQAGLEQAQSAASEAAVEHTRAKDLFQRGVTTKAALNTFAAAERQSALAVEKAQATLSRFTAKDVDLQPDVIVAARNIDAAVADLTRARSDLNRAAVLAPITGVILDVNARAGERPPANGIMEMGNTDQMMAEVEVYQDRIVSVAVGQPVELVAAAIGQTLQGQVQSIGLTVGRQGLISDDTAANTDARVITVMVKLNAPSSAIAARFTNLEVIARIDARSLIDTQASE
ncbi:MAG: HlyD family secretion protein [Ascidiaceihabitans sp.]|jgi:HlyD family secretion protein